MRDVTTYIYRIAALLSDMRDGTEPARTEHDLVVVNEGVLVHAPEDITSGYVVPDLRGIRSVGTLSSGAAARTL